MADALKGEKMKGWKGEKMADALKGEKVKKWLTPISFVNLSDLSDQSDQSETSSFQQEF